MPSPHGKCPPCVAQARLLLLVMQYRFFWNPKLASQGPTFQTQTFLHLISGPTEQTSEEEGGGMQEKNCVSVKL